MKFKKRSTCGPVVCGSAPLTTDLAPQRIYRPRERVSLRPDPKGLHDDLNAEVLGMAGENLRVRALHSFYFSPTERIVRAGDEFEVSRDEMFIVFLPD